MPSDLLICLKVLAWITSVFMPFWLLLNLSTMHEHNRNRARVMLQGRAYLKWWFVPLTIISTLVSIGFIIATW